MQISKTLKSAIDNSAKFSRSIGFDKIETEHLLFGLLLEKTAKSVRILSDFGVDSEKLKKYLVSNLNGLKIKIPNARQMIPITRSICKKPLRLSFVK